MKQLLKAGTAGAAGAIVAVVALFGGTALAGTGVGGVFNLGQTNTVNAQSVLTGTSNAALFKVANTGAGTGSVGLNIQVPSGRAPFVTNGTGKVNNLQADKVDGQSADEIARVQGASTDDSAWNEDARTVLETVTLTAPQNGFVVLAGIATPSYSNGCDFCAVHLRFHDLQTGADTAANAATVTQTNHTQVVPLSVTVTIPVTAGTHTYQLVGSWFDVAHAGVHPSVWYDASISAMFFRFNGAGTSVAPRPAPSQPSPSGPGGPLTQR
jgi:hypothetical protein